MKLAGSQLKIDFFDMSRVFFILNVDNFDFYEFFFQFPMNSCLFLLTELDFDGFHRQKSFDWKPRAFEVNFAVEVNSQMGRNQMKSVETRQNQTKTNEVRRNQTKKGVFQTKCSGCFDEFHKFQSSKTIFTQFFHFPQFPHYSSGFILK